MESMVNERDADGKTPLCYAAEKGDLQAVRWLVERNADVNSESKSGQTAFLQAAEMGHLHIVKWLVEEANVEVNSFSGRSCTALHYAVYRGHLNVIRWLVEERKVNVNANHRRGVRALHHAMEPEIIKYLVQNGADVNAQTDWGGTVLHSAAFRGQLDIMQWMIEEGNAEVNTRDLDGATALLLAARENHFDIVKYLLQRGADVIARTSDGRTLLHYAAKFGHVEIARWLVEEQGADVHEKTTDGLTPWIYAVMGRELPGDPHTEWLAMDPSANDALTSRLAVVRWLLQVPDILKLNAKTPEGNTALHWCAVQGNLDLVRCVVEGVRNVDIYAKNDAGLTAADLAQRRGFTHIFDYLSTRKNSS